MQNSPRIESQFAQRRLPWLIAAAALVFYLSTVVPWISLRGFATLAKSSGWDWRPVYVAPLHYLATFPVRWFPVGWQPAIPNILSAIFSAVTLGLLARSVAILPHDRTREQRHYERSEHSVLTLWSSWVPPLLAALVLGLQLTFWENAIVSTGEALDLMLFAYVIRCLLEFRINQRESWLTRAALVYGLGMTNNSAMIACLPLFVVAIIWIRGRAFFNGRFVMRMFGYGALGLSFYLLLPLIGVLSGATDQSFFEFLKINMGFQKSSLLGFPRYVLFLLSLVSIFPILFIGIKWPASFGDISSAGTALTNLMTHVIHAVFLLACIYVAFDPPFSARALGRGHPCLPLIYLGALSIGYFAGYFLLVFNPAAPGAFGRRSLLRRITAYGITALVWGTAIAVPVGLLVKNFEVVRNGEGPAYKQFGKLAAQSLPAEGAIVMSDDSVRLFALHSALASAGASDKYLLVDSSSLQQPAYHSFLTRRYKAAWPPYFNGRNSSERIDQLSLIQLVYRLSESKPVYYLHPSFGYYFESFYAVPNNIIYRLVPYTTNTIFAPTLTAEQVQQNDSFWQQVKERDLKPFLEGGKLLKAHKQQSLSRAFLGTIYSQAVNYFGVELQRRGDIQKAKGYFELALELNPDNVSALINSEYNRVLLDGGRESGPPSDAVVKKLGSYHGSWEAILQFNGPVDEPNSCYLLAQSFANGRNYRQSAQLLDRICQLTPENVPAQTALASIFVQGGRADLALTKIAEIRRKLGSKLTTNDQLLLVECEAWSQLIKNDLPGAEKILAAAQRQYPDHSEPYKAMAEIYLNRRDMTNAMATLGKLLDVQPNNVEALINSAGLKIRMAEYGESISYLDRALQLQPENLYGLLNRGFANLQLGNLEAARRDYEMLERTLPKPMHAVYYGLGEIAFKTKQKRTALQNYERYVKLAPNGTAEMKLVQERIKQLKSGTI
ncbi:MAG TPA: DUF2723 domain-containing protein [Verrucomicrobiae bacterium]|nr:DUF2723 domain-containing protein [Verrucomicrobiae bacterium]